MEIENEESGCIIKGEEGSAEWIPIGEASVHIYIFSIEFFIRILEILKLFFYIIEYIFYDFFLNLLTCEILLAPII